MQTETLSFSPDALHELNDLNNLVVSLLNGSIWIDMLGHRQDDIATLQAGDRRAVHRVPRTVLLHVSLSEIQPLNRVPRAQIVKIPGHELIVVTEGGKLLAGRLTIWQSRCTGATG